jgi:hypothetical protein
MATEAAIAVAATEALAVAALRVGFGLMTIAATSDTLFALLDGAGGSPAPRASSA